MSSVHEENNDKRTKLFYNDVLKLVQYYLNTFEKHGELSEFAKLHDFPYPTLLSIKNGNFVLNQKKYPFLLEKILNQFPHNVKAIKETVYVFEPEYVKGKFIYDKEITLLKKLNEKSDKNKE